MSWSSKIEPRRSRVGTSSAVLLACLTLLGAATPGLGNDSTPSLETPVLEHLQVGHWIEVRGTFDPYSTQFRADRLELREPTTTSQVWGVALPGLHPGNLQILGREVVPVPGAEWRDGDIDSALGQRVRATAEPGVSKRLLARRLQVRQPGVDRIVGRIDSMQHLADGSMRLRVLGFDVVVPPAVKQRTNLPPAMLQRLERVAADLRTPALPLQSSSIRWEDPEDFFGRGFELGVDLRADLQQELVLGARRNFDLDSRDDQGEDDRDDAAHQLRGRLTWLPTPKVSGMFDLSHRVRYRDPRFEASETDSQTRLRQAWLLVRDVGFGIDLQAGRQDIDEPREWLFDDSLDGLRLFRSTRSLDLQVSLTQSLDTGLERTSRRNRSATNAIVYVSGRSERRHHAAYVVHRDFADGLRERQTHVGVRSLGAVTERIRGWAELSYLDGERAARAVSAWGADLGITWTSGAPHHTNVTLGLARGSGDTGAETDHRFRQTGLQDNSSRVGGISAVRYYGELFDPELSNLMITTGGIGTRLGRRNSIELLGHTYTQVVPSTRLTNTNLERRPDGQSSSLGWEVDLVVGVRQFAKWDIELTAAYFHLGPAFESDGNATLGRLQIRYRY